MWRFRGGQKEGMKGNVVFTLLFVLLVLSIMPYYRPFVVNSGVTAPPRNPSTIQVLTNTNESDYTFTWTSRWQLDFQQVENGSMIIGDHIVISSTWNEFNDTVVVDSEPESPDLVVFDTYNLLRNITVNITIFGWNSTHANKVNFTNIFFGNYFAPNLQVNYPIDQSHNPSILELSQIPSLEIMEGLWNFTWSCTDLNANDTNYYSVWLSSDSGATFQLLQQNVSETYYLWDSDGFLERSNFVYRVRAYSLDFTMLDEFNNTLCSTDNPPMSYWPGDHSDAVSPEFVGDGPPRYPYPNVYVNHPPDLTFNENQEGKEIVWELNADSSGVSDVLILYKLYLNGTFHDDETIWIAPSSTVQITLNINEFTHGVYEFVITFSNPGYMSHYGSFSLDTIIVTILADTSTFFLGVGIGGGIVVGFAVLSILRLATRKK
ncbi:MAG: hypothetical protein ACW987_03255 [Candidatus Thorarchaeota archaeon]